eukprot:ctg_698.g334
MHLLLSLWRPVVFPTVTLRTRVHSASNGTPTVGNTRPNLRSAAVGRPREQNRSGSFEGAREVSLVEWVGTGALLAAEHRLPTRYRRGIATSTLPAPRTALYGESTDTAAELFDGSAGDLSLGVSQLDESRFHEEVATQDHSISVSRGVQRVEHRLVRGQRRAHRAVRHPAQQGAVPVYTGGCGGGCAAGAARPPQPPGADALQLGQAPLRSGHRLDAQNAAVEPDVDIRRVPTIRRQQSAHPGPAVYRTVPRGHRQAADFDGRRPGQIGSHLARHRPRLCHFIFGGAALDRLLGGAGRLGISQVHHRRLPSRERLVRHHADVLVPVAEQRVLAGVQRRDVAGLAGEALAVARLAGHVRGVLAQHLPQQRVGHVVGHEGKWGVETWNGQIGSDGSREAQRLSKQLGARHG